MNAASLYSPHDVRPGIPPARVPWGAVAVFLALAAGLGWLVCLPLWFGDGLASPAFQLFALGLMATPTIAALIVTFATVPRGGRARYLGLLPFRPIARKLWLFVLWPVLFLAIAFGALFLASALGWVEIDPAQTLLTQQLASLGITDVEVYVITQFLLLPVIVIQASVSAFGEELGWRGYLTTALSPMGFWPSALVIGVVWGLWHAPIILLGYNFGRTDIAGVLLMIGGCVAWGVLFGFLRLRSGSMWPAVFAHGALNASAGLPVLLRAAGSPLDPALAIALGVSGWIACTVVVVVLLLAGQFRRQPALAGPRGTAPKAPTR